MEFSNAMYARQSCREFSREPISRDDCVSLLEAANAAPVSMGNYAAVKLTVVQDAALIAAIEEAASTAMPKIGKHPMYQAPAVIVVSTKKESPASVGLAYANTGCIMENMMLRAADLGLGSVYLYAVPAVVRNLPELCGKLNIPDDFFPCAMMAVGKPAAALKPKTPTTEKIAVEWIEG